MPVFGSPYNLSQYLQYILQSGNFTKLQQFSHNGFIDYLLVIFVFTLFLNIHVEMHSFGPVLENISYNLIGNGFLEPYRLQPNCSFNS
jgi:hypothetical protein